MKILLEDKNEVSRRFLILFCLEAKLIYEFVWRNAWTTNEPDVFCADTSPKLKPADFLYVFYISVEINRSLRKYEVIAVTSKLLKSQYKHLPSLILWMAGSALTTFIPVRRRMVQLRPFCAVSGTCRKDPNYDHKPSKYWVCSLVVVKVWCLQNSVVRVLPKFRLQSKKSKQVRSKICRLATITVAEALWFDIFHILRHASCKSRIFLCTFNLTASPPKRAWKRY